MREQIVNIEQHDDYHSARDKMGQVQVDRILLVWPSDLNRKNIPLSRKLDLLLIHRHASRLGAHLGVVSDLDEIIDHAKSLGVPIFNSVTDAHTTIWRSRKSLRPQIARSDKHSNNLQPAKQHLSFIRQPKQQLSTRLHTIINSILYGIALLSIGILMMLTIPYATIYLIPELKIVNHKSNITSQPEPNPTIQTSYQIDSSYRTAIVSEQIDIDTTGTTKLSIQHASGNAIFTNLTFQPVTIPSGTSISTSSKLEPITYVTQNDISIEGRRGSIGIAEIRALIAGPEANVSQGLVNKVDGPLNQLVAVTNRQSITGGETVTVPSVTRTDRSKAYDLLVNKLSRQGYEDISDNLSHNQITTFESTKLAEVLDTNYSHAVGEPTDTLTLIMRAEIICTIIDKDNAYKVALDNLQSQTNTFMVLDNESITYQTNIIDTLDNSNNITIEVIAEGKAYPYVDINALKKKINWMTLDMAKEEISASIRLKEMPTIVIYPSWFTRIPWLSWRTNIVINSPEQETNK